MSGSITPAELAASLSARGVRTTAGEAEATLRVLAERGVTAEREGRWTLTPQGAEVARGLRSLEEEHS